jgi:hypothetical protein
MSSALTRISRGLSLGLLMALVLFFSGDANASAARIASAAELSLERAIGPVAIADPACQHKPKKRHCRHAGRATAAIIEIATKRRVVRSTSAHADLPFAAPAEAATGHRSDELHLRQSYGSVYAATRRMHI